MADWLFYERRSRGETRPMMMPDAARSRELDLDVARRYFDTGHDASGSVLLIAPQI